MREHEKRLRATAVVEWTRGDTSGVLVYADHKGFWHLPGGEPQRHERGRQEAPLVTAARSLSAKTGLETWAAMFLFRHAGARHDHHVFLLQARGTLSLVNVHEALAIGVCGPDMSVAPLVAAPGFFTGRLKLLSSVKEIVARYYEHSEQPARPEPGAAGLSLLSGVA